MERTKKKIEWSTQEIALLTELYPQFSSKKWKRISEVFQENGFKRTEMECREKWINFLDPGINRKEWEEWQLEKLYEVHQQVGTRWCVVQKFIGRTQNKIKNRFYGTLRNYIRFVVNHFDRSNTCFNYEISKLSPKFLNELYQAQSHFKFIGQEIKNTIYAMRFRIEKNMLADKIKEARPLYERLNALIFKAFEEIDQAGGVKLKREGTAQIKNQLSSIANQDQSQIQQAVQQLPPLSLQPIQQPFYPLLSLYPYQQNVFYWYV